MQEQQKFFLEQLATFRYVPWEQIPDLGLYMDQVITFVERQYKGLYGAEGRIVTPTMVNNYVKMGLVNRPVSKKYGKEQLAQLLMICTLKQGASAEGMKRLLALPEGGTVQALYEEFCRQQRQVFDELGSVLPLPSLMDGALRNAAYGFWCNAVLQPEKKAEPEKARRSSAKGHGVESHRGEDAMEK